MQMNESILDDISREESYKDSVKTLADSVIREQGRYLFQFTAWLDRYWTTLPESFSLFDRVTEKIEYYLESFRFVRKVTDVLFYEFQDNLDFSRNGYKNVPNTHPNLYVLDKKHSDELRHIDIEIYFDADIKSGYQVYQLFKRFFLPIQYFKIIDRKTNHYLCYTDNNQDIRVEDTRLNIYDTASDNLISSPDDVNWNWLEDYDMLTAMCKIYLDEPDYTPYDVLRAIHYNNIDTILQEAFEFDKSEFEEHVFKVGHFNKIGPRKDVYGIVGKYSGIDKIEQKPIAGYLQLYTADGYRDGAYSSPWSPTSRSPERVVDFCETQPFTVYLLRYDGDMGPEE